MIYRSRFPDVAIPKQSISACVFAGFATTTLDLVLAGEAGPEVFNSRMADTGRRGFASCNARKALPYKPFRSFYWRSGRIPNVRYTTGSATRARR